MRASAPPAPATPSRPAVFELKPVATPAEPASARPDVAPCAPAPAPDSHGREIAPGAVPQALLAGWLEAVCRQIPGVEQGIVLLDADARKGRRATVCWPEGAHDTPRLLAAAEHAFTQASPVVHAEDDGAGGGAGRVRIGCPVHVASQPRGVVAVRVQGLTEHQRDAVVQILGWGSRWLELLLEQGGANAVARLPALLQGLEGAFNHARFEAVALAVVTHLAHHLGFERVSLGLVRRRAVELVALSDSPSVSRRTGFVQSLEQAMGEAIDSDTVTVYPSVSGAGAIAHEALAQHGDALAVCSVPLRHAGRPFAVLTFERVSDRELDAQRVQLCAALGAALGPMLDLKRLQDRPWWSLGGTALLGPVTRRRATARRVGVLLLVLAAAAVLDATTGEHRVAAPATVQGRVQRAVIAPFDGFVESAPLRAGDRVKQGMILARLEDSPLLLEQRKWRSQREELVKQYRRALASRDRAESMVLEARVAQADAELALLAAQLERVELRAPFDGVVVRGDLSQSLGAPVTRGEVLFEVAPLDGYRVVLEVDERDVGPLRIGQRGTLALTGTPDARVPFTVQKIATSARAADGRNVVRVEARLQADAADLRPGMRGIAKVAAGERSLLWIWTHRLVDWARLTAWSWLPLP